MLYNLGEQKIKEIKNQWGFYLEVKSYTFFFFFAKYRLPVGLRRIPQVLLAESYNRPKPIDLFQDLASYRIL